MEEKETSKKRYNRLHMKMIGVSFNIPAEQKIYDHVINQSNKSGYIKGLIAKDVLRNK